MRMMSHQIDKDQHLTQPRCQDTEHRDLRTKICKALLKLKNTHQHKHLRNDLLRMKMMMMKVL